MKYKWLTLIAVAVGGLSLLSGCDQLFGGGSGGDSGSSDSNELAETAWVVDDKGTKDGDADDDDRVIAFGNDDSFVGIWYDEYSTDLENPFNDTPLSDGPGGDIDENNSSGESGSYSVSGDTLNGTITERYWDGNWHSVSESFEATFSISSDTLTLDITGIGTEEYTRIEP